jgi:hypothetical protein
MKKSLILTSLFFLINIITVFAQEDPGGGEGNPCDPDLPCPLDTWVFVLAAVVLVITTLYLHLRNKKNNTAAL